VLFVSECVLAAFALAWSVPYLDLRVLGSDLADTREALRFGAVFFGANLLLMGIWRGGEVAVAALADSRSEIAFYSIASAMTMALSSLLGQASGLLLPSITGIHLRGEDDRFVDWMAVPLRYVTALACLGAVVVFAIADPILPVLLGPDFGPVATNLKVLALGLIPLGLIRTATSLAAVQKTSRQAVLIGVEGFAVFFALTLVFVPRWGSIGASAAVVAAFLVAGVRAGYRMGLARIADEAKFVRTVAATSVLAVFFIPGVPDVVAGAIAVVTFGALMHVMGVVRTEEIREGLRRISSS
jgi:O-antigen/teichoic acid export membrane protein